MFYAFILTYAFIFIVFEMGFRPNQIRYEGRQVVYSTNKKLIYYYTGKGEGYSEKFEDAQVFYKGGSFFNTTGNAIYCMREVYGFNGIGIKELPFEEEEIKPTIASYYLVGDIVHTFTKFYIIKAIFVLGNILFKMLFQKKNETKKAQNNNTVFFSLSDNIVEETRERYKLDLWNSQKNNSSI